jgi:K(+)-stimulated pyrophosphate-energized sodium pump
MNRKNDKSRVWRVVLAALMLLAGAGTTFASEADINLPDLGQVRFFDGQVPGLTLLYGGLFVCLIGLVFALIQYNQIKNLPVHSSMGAVSETIWETCKTYLIQQGKFLAGLWLVIGLCVLYYYRGLQDKGVVSVVAILLSSVLGILGSYGVAWFGIRINTKANSRSAF